ncbi:MAG: GntR family transcriptional regulator [Bacillota bacterium]
MPRTGSVLRLAQAPRSRGASTAFRTLPCGWNETREGGPLRLDRQSGVPLYLQIEERIRLGIAQGVWRVGDLLPPEEELCRKLGVSRGPVRQALGRLVQDGIIVRDRRRGTRVVRGIRSHGLILVSPYRAIEVAGLTPTITILAREIRPVPRAVAARWKQGGRSIRQPRQAVFFERVFNANGEPVAHACSWLPADRFIGLATADLTGAPLLDILAQEYEVVITRLEETMELTTMSARNAELLGVHPGSPCLAVTLCQWAGDQPVEYAEFWLTPAKSRFLITGLLALENNFRSDPAKQAATAEDPHGRPTTHATR